MQSKVALAATTLFFLIRESAREKASTTLALWIPRWITRGQATLHDLTQVADRVHLPLGSQLAALSGAGGAWIVTNCRSDVRMDVSAPKALFRRLAATLIDPPMSCLADMPQFWGVRNRTVLYQGSIELTSSW